MHKKIASLVTVALIGLPFVASAATIGDLQSQIQALLTQIAQLKGQLSSVPQPSLSTCVSLTTNLELDDTDADTDGNVSALQQFLAGDYSTYPEGRITGYFGPATMRAVQRWQKAHGLVSSGDPDTTGYGYVGRKTRAAMACSTPPPPQPISPEGSPSGYTTVFDPSVAMSARFPDTTTLSADQKHYEVPNQNPSKYYVGRVNFDVKKDAASVAACMSGDYTTTINGNVYAVTNSNTASYGQTTAITTYKTVKNTWCYIITSTLTGTNINGLTSTQAAEAQADYLRIKAANEAIVQSVRIYDLPTVSPATPTSIASPTCTLSLTTTRGTETVTSSSQSGVNSRIMIWNNEPLTIKWSSSGATQAYDYAGMSIPLAGSQTIQPPQLNRTYQYQFNSVNGITTCTAVIYPASAGIDQWTLASNLPNPTITGTAAGVQSVEVTVKKTPFDTVRIFDQTVPVVNGHWSASISPALVTGTYQVDIYGPPDQKLNYLVSGTLAVNTTGQSGNPVCTVTASPDHAFVNQLFTVSWSSSGIANTAPTFATGPSIYVGSHSGTFGVILESANGSRQFSDDKAETMTFQLGTGGIAGGPFTQRCAVNVPIADNSGSFGTSINVNSLYPHTNTAFAITGTSADPNGSTLYVVIMPASYSGNRDWSAVQGLVVSGGAIWSASAAVSYGTWNAGYVPGAGEETKYTVLVYSPSHNNALVATGLIYITDKG